MAYGFNDDKSKVEIYSKNEVYSKNDFKQKTISPIKFTGTLTTKTLGPYISNSSQVSFDANDLADINKIIAVRLVRITSNATIVARVSAITNDVITYIAFTNVSDSEVTFNASDVKVDIVYV